MYTKYEHTFKNFEGKSNNSVVNFYFQLNQLKNLYRQGWISMMGEEFINKCESVADHAYSLAMLSDTVIKKYELSLNKERCVKMAMVHELGEIYVGDLTPEDNVNKEQKHNLEKEAIKRVLNICEWQEEYYKLWEEYEAQETEEAIFIKELDSVEFLMQGASYGYNIRIFRRSLGNVKNKVLLEIIDELKELTKDGATEVKL